MEQRYNILRTAKVKNRKQITDAIEHNLRLRVQENIDPKRTPDNIVMLNALGADLNDASDFQKKLSAHYVSLGVKEKKDNVLLMEFVVSATPDFFLTKTKAQVDQWVKDQVDFFKEEFEGQLKMAVLHMDETTPHLHFMIGTELKSVKKYKNRYGVTNKECWSLNADRYNPEFLRGLHDRHALKNKKHGLKRGVKGSMRKHTELKEFYDIVDKALDTDYQRQIENTIESLETGLISKKVSIDEVRKKFAPMLNTLLKQNKALKAKFVLDIKQWATELHDEAETLKKEREEVDRMKNHYGKGLRTISDLQAKNNLQQQLIDAKDREIEELKAQLPTPKRPANFNENRKKA